MSSYLSNASALSALVSLITDATKVVEAHFHSELGYTPSLDDTTEHPFDSQLSPPHIRQAVQIIEGACAQLCATVLKPRTAVYNVREICRSKGVLITSIFRLRKR